MQAYTGFAQVYDTFMDNVPYDGWAGYLTGLLQEYGVKDGLVLELGCGSGKITRRLASKGYDMIGIDISEEMLEIARERECVDVPIAGEEEDGEYFITREKEYGDASTVSEKKCTGDLTVSDSITGEKKYGEAFGTEGTGFRIPHMESIQGQDKARTCKEPGNYDRETADNQVGKNQILYLQQDMREFELYGTVGAVVSVCDSMNYITSEEDLLKVFRLVNNYLDPRGIFIFDMNTEYKYKNLLADNTITENREKCSLIWENYYDEEEQINEYNITVFAKIKTDETEDKYRYHNHTQLFMRFQETHYQKAYSIERVKQLIENAGMEFIAVYDAFTRNLPEDTSERVYFIAREKYQENKKYV